MSLEKTINLKGEEQYYIKLIGFLLGTIALTITCFIDDTKGVKPLTKLFGQLIAATIVVVAGLRIGTFNLPFLNNLEISEGVSVALTIIWIIGITNAINLMDGLDGLSSGISAISCVSLLIIFALNGSPLIAIIMVTALAGALAGFLPFNFKPAKTFIGDTGSNFLGYTLAIVSIIGVAKTYTAAVIVLPVIVLGLPILDTVWAIIRRIIKGKSLKAVFMADKGHLHHRLVGKGFTQKQTVLILYAISASFGMFAVIIFDSGIWKALSFALILIAILAFGYINFSKGQEDDEDEMFECMNCKYIYNPKSGNELAGINPGTSFKKIPKDWHCPVCGENKDMFKIHEE